MTATKQFKVLVLGGYGVFGRRICERLVRDSAFEIVVAGRSGAKANDLVEELRTTGSSVGLSAEKIDIEQDLDASLARIKPDLAIHTAGPFQDQDYCVAQACIAQGVHYVDLSDGRAFCRDFTRLDSSARAASVIAVTGASSVPGLAGAAIDHLRPGIAKMEIVEIAITPGNRAPRGTAVMAAILGQVGRPHQRWQDSEWRVAHGWQDLRRREFPELGRRWLSACDVPDLDLLPVRFPELRTATFHAGLELSFLHLGLWLLSWPVRWRLAPRLGRFAGIFKWCADRFLAFGTDRGGMMVRIVGHDAAGAIVERTWQAIAGAGHGPYIPCIPAVLIARRLARQAAGRETIDPGARACFDIFSIDDFLAEVADLDIAAYEDAADG